MNILVITTGNLPMPPVKGGAVEHLVQTLIDSNECMKKHKYTVYSVYDKQVEFEKKKYKFCDYKYIEIDKKIHKIQKGIRYLINRYLPIYIGNFYINKVIKDIKHTINTYDLIIIENTPQYVLPLRKIYKGKIVLHLHNDYLNVETEFSKKILNSFNEIYTLSNFVNFRVNEIYKDNKVKTLYNGVDTKRFLTNKDYDNLKHKYNIKADEKVILYTGRIVSGKGVKELIQAFLKVTETKNKIKLIIVGSANYGKNVEDNYWIECKRLAKKREKDIIFTGYQPFEEIMKYYKIANIGVVPSIDTEGFALTVVEHMASGNPVIISDSGGMPELVNNRCGIVVKRGDEFVNSLAESMLYLIENELLCYDMGRYAMKQAQKFDVELYIQNYNNLIDSIS